MTQMPPLALLPGGLATRLRPHTLKMPKAMIEVASAPSLPVKDRRPLTPIPPHIRSSRRSQVEGGGSRPTKAIPSPFMRKKLYAECLAFNSSNSRRKPERR
jgi:hypothetical protein